MTAEVQKMIHQFHFPGRQGVRYRIDWEEVTLYTEASDGETVYRKGGVSVTPRHEFVEGTGADTVGGIHEVLPPRLPGITFVSNTRVTEVSSEPGVPSSQFESCVSCGGGLGGGGQGDSGWTVGQGSIGGGGAGIDARFSLGTGRFGVPAGELFISEGRPSPYLARPLSLRCAPNVLSAVEVISTNGQIRQVKAEQTLANVMSHAYGYDIQFYSASQVGAKVGGFYTVTGDPFVTWSIDNPNGGTDFNSLQIERTPGWNEDVWLFTWDPEEQKWVLSHPGDVREDQTIVFWDDDNQILTSTNLVGTAAGDPVARAVRKYQVFGDSEYEGTPLVAKVIEEASGPADAPVTTRYVYDPSELSLTGRVPMRWQLQSSGYWEFYEYDPDDSSRMVRRIQQFGNVSTNGIPDANTNSCRIAEYEYDPAVAVPGSNDTGRDPQIPRRTIGWLLGAEVERSYVVLLADERRDIRCVTAGAAWNAADNLVTTNRTYPAGHTFQGKLKSVDHPDGTRQVYFYSTNATEMTMTVLSGEADAASATNIVRGTRTVRVFGSAGQPISTATYDKVSGITLDSAVNSDFDAYNRPQMTVYLDGSTNQVEYSCCGPDYTVDRDGTLTQFFYDAMGRQVALMRLGVTTTNALDPAGNVLMVKRIGTDLSEIVLREASYDLAGRVTNEVNALGGETWFGYGQTARYTTNHDGGTRIETYFQDGQLDRVTGTATHPVRYEYGVESGKRYTKEIQLDAGGSDTAEWTKTYQDFAGRTEKTLYPDGAYSQSFYNLAGQMWKSRDPDNVITLYRYNGSGEAEYTVTALTTNAQGFTSYSTLTNQFEWVKSNTDRVSRVESSVLYNGTLGVNVRRTVSSVWATNNSNVAVAIATNDVATDGLRSWQVTWSGAVVLTNRTTRGLPGASNYTYATNTAPDGSFTVTKSQYGRVLEVTRKNSGGSQLGKTTFAYDSHGRQSTVTDARNGATTYTHNDADLVESVTTPAPGTGQPAQTSWTFYNLMLQAAIVVYADGTSVTNEYWPSGELKRIYGSRTYPVGYGYSAQGRLTTMTNWSTFNPTGAGVGARVTTWVYDTARGWLIKKIYAGESDATTDYFYTLAGRFWKRVWERGVTTTNTYVAGDLSTVTYSDGTTPNVTYGFDRRGRRSTVTQGTNTTSFTLDDAGQLLAENHTAGILSGVSVTNGFDAYLRRTRLHANTATAFTNLYGYDTASRLTGVTNGVFSAGYTYLANSPLLNQVTFKQSGTTRMTTTRQWDFLNRLGSIGSVPAAANQFPLSYGYLCNDANQRVRVTLADGSFWLYSYDVLGQVVSGKRYWSDGTPVPGQQYEYGFDDIGNRTIAKAGGDAAGGNLRWAGYTNNVANQLTSRGVPGAVDVVGIATASAAVTVNSSAADYRRGEYFQELLTVGNTLAPQWTLMTVTASQGGTNTTQTVYAYVPKAPEAFQYDADGNLTNDGRWAYIWDAENRLVKMEPSGTFAAASGSRRSLEFWYDHQGRRVRKKVTNIETSLVTDDRKFLYDGWNLLAELSATNNAVIRSYVWGLDLSGSEQGAGGVGGLLFEMPAGTNTLCVAYDGNGNVMGLVDATAGTVVAQFEYGPFGELLRVSGTAAAGNPFRFSTKYQDAETDLLYYGFRYYNPSTGRWINRDPLNEPTGLNLYGFVRDDPLRFVDTDGRQLAPPLCARCGQVALQGHTCVAVVPRTCAPPPAAPALKRPIPEKDRACCTDALVKKGEDKLRSDFQRAVADAEKFKVKPSSPPNPLWPFGGGGAATCKNSSTDVMDYLLPTPACWQCYLEERNAYSPKDDPNDDRRDHQVVICVGYPIKGPRKEIIFDWWGGMTSADDFRREYPYLARVCENPYWTRCSDGRPNENPPPCKVPWMCSRALRPHD